MANKQVDVAQAQDGADFAASGDQDTPVVVATIATGPEVQPAPAVKPAPTVAAKVMVSAPPTRKVRGLRSRTSNIAGEVYHVEEGRDYTLPVDVATILSNAGIVTII